VIGIVFMLLTQDLGNYKLKTRRLKDSYMAQHNRAPDEFFVIRA